MTRADIARLIQPFVDDLITRIESALPDLVRAELIALVDRRAVAVQPTQPVESKRGNTCSKCGAAGYTARTCGKTHNVAAKPARRQTPPGELVPLNEVVSFGRLGPP